MMKQFNKDFRRRMALCLLAVIALYFLATVCYDMAVGNRLTDVIGHYTFKDEDSPELDYVLYSDGGMIEVERLWIEAGKVTYTVKGTQEGEVFLLVRRAGEEVGFTAEQFSVDRSGNVTCVYTGNYSNCRFHLLMNVVCLTVFAALCLINLLLFQNKLRYSYDMMFVGGLLIWLTCTVIIQWYEFLHFEYVFNYYENLRNSAYQFMLYTAPVVWSFCIALSVSNISLIRHEGFRPVNALGILLSVLLMFGGLVGFVLNEMSGVYSSQMRIYPIAQSSFCSVYSLFACLLESAVISGIAAAKHTPPMDCDYIIILGCMIRKDGSLTPLLRGRVDRAIEHGVVQERTTGKKVVFVPSGGQGSDEIMAEGEAMKQYLLSRGIPEERILVEDKSRNTAENMRFSRKLIEERKPDAKIAFSTTNYHVFRSGTIAVENGFCPEGMGSRTKWYFWPNAFIREFIGMTVYTKFTIALILILLIAGFAGIETMIVR